MADITFDAKLREKAGKGAARACRREGRVPAVIYGGNKRSPDDQLGSGSAGKSFGHGRFL